MNAPMPERQIIRGPDGNPLYVLVPFDEYEVPLERSEEAVFLPLEVSKIASLGGKSLIRAWREHLGLTQEELARRMGISRAAYAQMEAKDARPRMVTLKKIASALGVEWEQLRG